MARAQAFARAWAQFKPLALTVARALDKTKLWPRVLAKTWAQALAEVLAKALAMVMAR